MDEFELPEDLQGLTPDQLVELETRAVELFDQLNAAEPTPQTVAAMSDLAAAIQAIRGEQTRRAEEAEQQRAEADKLVAQVHGTPEAEGTEDEQPTEGDDENGDESEQPTEPEPQPTEQPPAEQPPAEQPPEAVAAAGRRHDPRDDLRRTRKINIPLSEVRKRAPQPEPTEPALEIIAASDLRGIGGKQIEDLETLAKAFTQRASRMATTRMGKAALDSAPTVATITNRYDTSIAADASPIDTEQVMRQLTSKGRTVEAMASMVAAGGWCAPSETRYDFFDITCEDGQIDLPTTGIERGGVRVPQSLSFADFVALVPAGGAALGTDLDPANNTMPWLWTEADDIAATGQPGGPDKLCLRAPCPDFDEWRLECYGVCITAGNLTDDAYPELTQKIIRLAMAAHSRTMNARTIGLMVAASTACATGGFFDQGGGATADMLASIEWAAIDYRNRFGMCDNDVLEVVLPSWVRAVVRADLSRRTGMAEFAITNDQIGDWFDLRGVRVQWVRDWQVAGTNQPGGATATMVYPGSVNFLMYAAGTFVKGNGMTLDLGPVRDSVLNATNDHTAVWTEECNLVARIGHESRCYTVSLCAGGRTGAADIVHCGNS